ncbi:hypothetical protein SAMN05660971_01411 [Halomonas cupida]|uniref:Uncharacterized protein n=1 Tax=Halomonas cupida TaxID=44933 RepID=A0A1M7DNK6_9GAMM|nr:hypothetical protein SAMN05660971_01411 [Halomonas cupida]
MAMDHLLLDGEDTTSTGVRFHWTTTLTSGENWRQSAVQMIDVLLKGMQVSR